VEATVETVEMEEMEEMVEVSQNPVANLQVIKKKTSKKSSFSNINPESYHESCVLGRPQMRFCCGSSYLTALGKYKVSYSTDPGIPSRFPDAHEIFGGPGFSYALGKYKVSYSTDPAMPSRFPDAHEIFGCHSFS
jgi:hypothetical protein